MLSGRLTQTLIRGLDRVISKTSARDTQTPAHQLTGRRGEEDAYFYLRRRGYVMVARNFRTARHHGEIDLIGWDKDVLCFIEVKTRTTRDVKPAAAAVDREKRRAIRIVIRDYLRLLPERHFPEQQQWRFDVVTVYYEGRRVYPTFELFQNSLLSS
jgi:putative endonuclease